MGTADPELHPGSDDVPGVEVVPVRGLDDAALGRARRRRARWRSTRRSWPPSATTSPPPAATRPTSSSRRWPRRGASTAPTRRSAPRSRRPTGVDRRRCWPAARRDRRRSPPRSCASAFVGNAGIVSFVDGHDDRRQGRDAQPPVGGRAVRRRQHRRRRRHPRRDRRGAPADRLHRRPVLRPARPARRRPARRGAAPAPHPRRASSTASPTTATRSACRPSPARSLYDPAYTDEPARVLRLHRRRRRPLAARRPAPGRPRRRARRAHRPRRHPRRDVLQRHDGRHDRRGRRGQRADRRPHHREAADRRARRRRRALDGDHRLRCRRPVVGRRRDGRATSAPTSS